MATVAAPRISSDSPPVRVLAEQAFSRAAGAPLLADNAVELLIDAKANFEAWLAAIRAGQSLVLIENYIFRDDETGHAFLDALTERAAAGVRVCVIRDWLGCLGQSSVGFWQPLIDAGGEVRTFNPFHFTSPFGWLSRDHRKLLVVDNTVAFVGGICVSGTWLGDPARGIAPWRDTAIAVRGPALRDIADSFADSWSTLGEALPEDVLELTERCSPAGQVDLRVVATVPNTAGLYRLDQLIAAMARRCLWLTDAYFVGVAPYVQALSAAAQDGVDVRLLVPGTSDIPAVATVSRAGYRPLLEAGVRVFEWNGSMLHAKTAVADCRWARVGSSNLNLASWIGNCELDIAIEDETFARRMEAQYESDLSHSTEIVLKPARRWRKRGAEDGPRTSGDASAGEAPGVPASAPASPPRASERVGPPYPRARGGSSGRAAAGALRLANSVGAAITNRRVLGRTESTPLLIAGALLLLSALIGLVWPRLVAWPFAALTLWVGASLVARYLVSRTRGDDGDR
jgi:cardiolipin synthase A/B